MASTTSLTVKMEANGHHTFSAELFREVTVRPHIPPSSQILWACYKRWNGKTILACSWAPPSTFSSVQLCCLMSSDVGWHIRDKLRPTPKHGSIRLYVHGNPGRSPRLSHSSWTMKNYDHLQFEDSYGCTVLDMPESRERAARQAKQWSQAACF